MTEARQQGIAQPKYLDIARQFLQSRRPTGSQPATPRLGGPANVMGFATTPAGKAIMSRILSQAATRRPKRR